MEMSATSGDLPRNVVGDILTRLPGKSLMRFKCVRKSWHALIQSRSFIEQHFLKQTALSLKGQNSTYLAVSDGDFDVSVLSAENLTITERISPPPPFFKRYGIRRIEVCNGILCLDDHDDNTVLWNPATQELKPLSKRNLGNNTSYASTGSFGFSFHPKINDYKVVKFAEYSIPGDYESPGYYTDSDPTDYVIVCLYTLSTDSWKKLDSSVVPENCLISYSTAYVNGSHHFLAYKPDYYAILSVDVTHEVVRILPLPDYATSLIEYNVDFVSFNESLACFVYPKKRGENCFELWVMNYGGKKLWTRQLTIGPLVGVHRPLGFWKNGAVSLEDVHGRLVLYDHSTQEIKNIHVKDHSSSLQVLHYVPSLFPINGSWGHEDAPFVQSQTSEIQGREDGASFDSHTSEIQGH